MGSGKAGDIVLQVITIALFATGIGLFVWKILPGLLVLAGALLFLPSLIKRNVDRPSAGE